MDLSIIIVTYNSSAFIGVCLRSLVEQMRGLDHEILLVDNASSDETCGLIREEFPVVTLIESPSNVGFARANNLGLQKATGDFVLLINPDTLWKRGDVRGAIQFLRDHPEIGGLGCRLVLREGSWQKSHGYFPTLGRELKEALYLPRFFPEAEWARGMFIYKEKRGPRMVDWVSATFFLCPRKILLDVDGFDDRYFMYYEDIDLSKKIRERGKGIVYDPEVEIVHYQRAPSVYDFGESPYLYFEKHFGLSFAETLRYVFLLKFFIRILIFALWSLFTGKEIFREKRDINYRSLKFHLFEAGRILKRLGDGFRKQTD
jgi:GT2 family glycosyltransferase